MNFTLNINILNILALIGGIGIIWKFLPEDYKHELGAVVGYGITLLWIAVWVVYFPVMGHNLYIK